MINKNVYIWSCDLETFRGEGVLAWLFINELKKYCKKKIIVESFKKKIIFNKSSKKIIRNQITFSLNFFTKYILPFYGLLKCWIYYFNSFKVSYVNYLPLWNPLILFLLPPGTILGPITGGIFYDKKKFNSVILRKIFMPFIYKISAKFLILKKKILFSTSLLGKFIDYKIKKKCIFNFVLLNFNKPKKIYKKNIDIIIYYRNHSNKHNHFIYELAKRLLLNNFTIVVIGDFMPIEGIINKGNIQRSKALKLIGRSAYAINSGENSLSLFAIDCLSRRTKIFCNKKNISEIMVKLKDIVYPINFEIFDSSINKVCYRINKKSKVSFDYLPIIKEKKKIHNLLSSYFVE